MIPNRSEIQAKVDQYFAGQKTNSLLEFMTDWLDGLDLPETIMVASNQINPKEQILSDLESYVRKPS